MEKRVGVAIDFSVCSKAALKWAVNNLVRDGDHLILINVQTSGVHYEGGEIQLWEDIGSPFIPLKDLSNAEVLRKYGLKPDAETLDILNCAAREKEIEIIMKIFWGDAREKICTAIDSIPLNCLVIGSRGLSKLKRAFLGSVSNYVMNNGSCAITVVKSGEHE